MAHIACQKFQNTAQSRGMRGNVKIPQKIAVSLIVDNACSVDGFRSNLNTLHRYMDYTCEIMYFGRQFTK